MLQLEAAAILCTLKSTLIMSWNPSSSFGTWNLDLKPLNAISGRIARCSGFIWTRLSRNSIQEIGYAKITSRRWSIDVPQHSKLWQRCCVHKYLHLLSSGYSVQVPCILWPVLSSAFVLGCLHSYCLYKSESEHYHPLLLRTDSPTTTDLSSFR